MSLTYRYFLLFKKSLTKQMKTTFKFIKCVTSLIFNVSQLLFYYTRWYVNSAKNMEKENNHYTDYITYLLKNDTATIIENMINRILAKMR